MNINIRNEEPKDYRKVEEIAREAFWNLYFPGGHEHYVVHKMRSHPDFIKALAFVIEVDDEIEGLYFTHILRSYQRVVKNIRLLALGRFSYLLSFTEKDLVKSLLPTQLK